MDKYNFEHSTKFEQDMEIFLKRYFEGPFQEICYQKILDLNAEFAYSEEPVAFSDIKNLKFKKINVDEVWSKKNFACAWFHLTGKLDKSIDRTELYLEFGDDGEGLLVDKDGHSLKGFTAGSVVFGAINYAVEKKFYPIDEIVDSDGNIDCYIDCASNSLYGEFAHDAYLTAAQITRKNQKALSVFLDFDVLYDFALINPVDSEIRNKIILGLKDVKYLYIYNSPDEAYDKAKKITKELFSLPGDDKIQTTCVGHAHMDLAWLWPIRETKRKIKRTFANVVYLCNKYPDFHFMVSQAQQVQWIKELDAKLYDDVKVLVKKGQIEIIGGGWVENDTNVPSEESLVRQELYGQKFWQEEFGHYVDVRWLPDTFGYTGSLPQILKQSGQDYFMTIKLSWSNRTKFPYNTFHWAGIDGSKVIVHMPPEGDYNSWCQPHGLKHAEAELRKEDPKDSFLTVYGIGDGGGGPSETMVERIHRQENLEYLPKMKHGVAQQFFHTLDGKDLPTYQGEMYLERHRATYTSQSNNKNSNRKFENQMGTLETFLSCLGKQIDKKTYDDLWKEALLYQFHDILPGSSINRVYDETDIAYEKILNKLEDIANKNGVSFIASNSKSLINPQCESVERIEKVDNGYLFYKGNAGLITPIVYNDGKERDIDKVTTDYFTAEFDSDGSFKSIVTVNGEKITGFANKIRVFIDDGDAWDFDDDYREQKEVYMTLDNISCKDFGELIEVVENYSFKNSKLKQTLLFHKNSEIITVNHKVDWKDTGYMIRAEFKPEAWSDIVKSDIQFGYLDRPTTDETEHERAQYEICCQKWFDLSNESKGLAIINNAKNGFMAKGGIISVDLLRSFNYPCIDSEHHNVEYSYAIYPHIGGFNASYVDEKASAFNRQALYGDKNVIAPRVDNDKVMITAFKQAYDGDGYIVRMFERTGEKTKTKFILPKGFMLKEQVNLLEDKIGEGKCDYLTFKPFEIKSFRVIKQ